MSSLKQFLRNTLVGGLMFLVPLVLIVVVLRHAMQLAAKIARPLAAVVPAEHIGGIGVGTLLSALVLLGFCFLAGLIARTGVGRRLTHYVEDSLLGSLPQYRMVKSLAQGLTQVEDGAGFRPALVSMEGGWQLGYLLETVQDGWVAVFLPQSPTPMSGNIMYLPAARVRELDMPIAEAVLLVKRMGVGSAQALGHAALTPVPED